FGPEAPSPPLASDSPEVAIGSFRPFLGQTPTTSPILWRKFGERHESPSCGSPIRRLRSFAMAHHGCCCFVGQPKSLCPVDNLRLRHRRGDRSQQGGGAWRRRHHRKPSHFVPPTREHELA